MPEDYDIDLESSGAIAEEDEIGKKRIGFLPAVVIKILKWAAFILVAIVFIVTVVVVTIKIMSPVSATPDIYLSTEDFSSRQPSYQWYEIGTTDVRARTADLDKRVIVIIRVAVGFNPRSKALHTELIDKTPKLRDEIRVFFGTKYEKDLLPQNDARLKEELKRRLNSFLMGSETIQDVIFTELNVVEF